MNYGVGLDMSKKTWTCGEWAIYSFFNALGVTALLWACTLILPELESNYYPVLDRFTISEYQLVGRDVEITASVRKTRNCQYLAPWRARSTRSGRVLEVVHQSMDTPNWSTGVITTTFKITNAGSEPIDLFAEHQCHPGWTVFSRLGQFTFR